MDELWVIEDSKSGAMLSAFYPYEPNGLKFRRNDYMIFDSEEDASESLSSIKSKAGVKAKGLIIRQMR